MKSSFQTAQQALLPTRPGHTDMPDCFDLAIIGAGINGAALAMEASQRGLTVLLVDKNDIGSGTTAYSTRLIHGGLRYLENLEFGLVRESLREREYLLRNAPHLVRPLQLGIPVYQSINRNQTNQSHHTPPTLQAVTVKTNPKKRRDTLWILAGMIGYSVLSLNTDMKKADKKMLGFKYYGKTDFLKRFPGIYREGLTGGFLYYDAQVNFPERLSLEYVIAAHETGNTIIKTHARVEDISIQTLQDGTSQAYGIVLADLINGEHVTAKARVVLNAAGPWVDNIIRLSHPDNISIPDKIGGTQGTHIVVKRFPSAPPDAVYAEASNSRPFFVIPWQQGKQQDFLLIGTTDDRYLGDLDHVVASERDIDFLLQEVNRLIPEATLTRADILYSYSGVRPLPNDADKPEGQITRKHIIFDHVGDSQYPVQNFISLIGGKLTTARNLAEETVDYTIKRYFPAGIKIKPSTSRISPLPGGAGITDIDIYKRTVIEAAVDAYGISREIAAHLIDLYGSRFKSVLELIRHDAGLKEPLVPDEISIKAQVVYAIEEEFAISLIDMMRRIGENLNAHVGLDIIRSTAEVAARVRGWGAKEMAEEIEAYTKWVTEFNLAHLPPGIPASAGQNPLFNM